MYSKSNFVSLDTNSPKTDPSTDILTDPGSISEISRLLRFSTATLREFTCLGLSWWEMSAARLKQIVEAQVMEVDWMGWIL